TMVCAVGAFLWPSGGANAAAGVLGGALIAGISYFGIRRGVDGMTAALSAGASARDGERGAARSILIRALMILVGRYALLALIAYVMISRLRLSPLGLLLGVSVIPLAVTIEVLAAFRAIKSTARGTHENNGKA
ncbi:MAG TPA: hypothetical protein VMZ90_07705, partial [Vicinamibacterales bacterium]|nr:hypothetical protein [Vicinamibacterales bacterium]